MTDRNFSAHLEYYKVFYYAAKYGRLTTAAERLNLTQPTVTSAIQKLEEQLQCSLFLRTRRGVSLTSEGKALWNRLEPAFQLLLTAEQELEDMRTLNGGSLSIASTEMSFNTYVLPVLARFSEDYPNVKVKFRNALTDSILDMLRNGEIDLAILHTPFEIDKHMQMQQIGEIEECFVAGPHYAFLAGKVCTLDKLQMYPFISVPEGSNTKAFARDIFSEHGLSYEPDIEVTTIELVIQAVKHNLGIAMLPWSRSKEFVDNGQMIKIPVEGLKMQRQAYVISNRDIKPGPAARAFLQHYLL